MMTAKKALTANMQKMLRIVRDFGGTGYAEIECQWGGYETGNDTRDIHLNWMVVSNICKALIRRGLVTDTHPDYTGPVLTEAGEAVVGKSRR